MRKVSMFAGVLGAVVSMSGLAFADSAEQGQIPVRTQAQTTAQTDAQGDQNLTYVKKLIASGVKDGLRLSGDLQTINTCMDAKFVAVDGQYQAVQFRRPGTDGQACGQIVSYKHVTTDFPGVQASNVIVEAKGYDVSVR